MGRRAGPGRVGAEALGVKTLIVSPYPPARDGLANYAVQLAKSLRAQGNRVSVVSPYPSGAEHNADFSSLSGMLKVVGLSRRADRTLVQFHPLFFLTGRTRASLLRQMLSLALLFRFGRDVRVYVHEADYEAGRKAGRRYALGRWVWQQADGIVVHTQRERAQIVEAFRLDPSKVEVVEHGAGFVPRAQDGRAAARRSLGVPDDAFVFLCIGFIQPHKGFDRALRGFARLGDSPRLRLDIVGSVRVPTPEHDAYLALLHRLARGHPGIHLHESYVNDVLFDQWILGCDVVVLPYRQIWSSSVVERAALYGRPAIITPVGGLPDQARPDTVVVRNEEEMVVAMAGLAGVPAPQATPEPQHPGDPHDEMQRLVSARGAALRHWYEPLAGWSTRQGLSTAQIPALSLPLPPRAITPKAIVLRTVHRLTRWELWPIVDHVNQLRFAILREQNGSDELGEDRAARLRGGEDPDSQTVSDVGL